MIYYTWNKNLNSYFEVPYACRHEIYFEGSNCMYKFTHLCIADHKIQNSPLEKFFSPYSFTVAS